MTQCKNKLNQQIRSPEDQFANLQNRAIYIDIRTQGHFIVRKKRSLLYFMPFALSNTCYSYSTIDIEKKT